jgi:hypothetical protein
MGETKSAYKTLIGRPDEKGALGRPTRKTKHNIKTDLTQIGMSVD